MERLLVSFLAFVVLLQSTDATYKTCGPSNLGKIAVDVCPDLSPTSGPCKLPRGHNVTMSVTFNATKDAPALSAVVHGVIAGIPVPFPFGQPDGCKDSGLTCPIKAGQTYTYKAVLSVLKSYPSISCLVKWELQDGQDDEFCALILVELV